MRNDDGKLRSMSNDRLYKLFLKTINYCWTEQIINFGWIWVDQTVN